MSRKLIPVLWTGGEKELTFKIDLVKKGDEVTVLILLLGKGNSSLNLKVEVRHQNEETRSRVMVKGALFDKARVDFNGLVKIEKGARGANAWLAAQMLLLSPQATGRVVPNLEIKEDDVKAGHAATVGRINDAEIFYLMSRGLSRETSTDLIVAGFLESMMKEFPPRFAGLARKAIQP